MLLLCRPPRHAATRRGLRVAGMSRADVNFFHALRVYERARESWKVFAVVDIEYERCTLRLLSVRFISHIPFNSRRSLSPPSLAPIKGRSLLSERRTRISSSSRHKFLSTALLLRSSPSRLAACTAGRDSRPPKPHLFESCTGEG